MKKIFGAFLFSIALFSAANSHALTGVGGSGECTGGGALACKETREIVKYWDAARKSCWIICKVTFSNPSGSVPSCSGNCRQEIINCSGSQTVANRELKLSQGDCSKYGTNWGSDCADASWDPRNFEIRCSPGGGSC